MGLSGAIDETASRDGGPQEQEGARELRKSRSDTRGFAQRNLEYIQSLAQQKKAAKLEEQEERERSQRMQQQLARRVLGDSYDRILSKSISLPRSTYYPGEQPPIEEDVGAQSEGLRLPVLVEAEGGDIRDDEGARTGGDDSADGGSCSSTGEDKSSSNAATPRAGAGAGRRGRGADGRVGGRRKHPLAPAQPQDSRALQRRAALLGQSTDGKLNGGEGSPGPRSPNKATAAAKPAGTTPDKEKGTLPPGASLYYTARAQAEAAAALQRAYAGASNTYAAYLTWRKQQKLKADTRVFCISGGGNHSNGIRAGLLARGWWENPDHNSVYFDLKWAIATQDINFEALWQGQVVNHFGKATCITTKVGLCQTLKELAWYEAADQRSFYPRAYDLGSETDRAAFLADARQTAAEAIVKRAALEGEVTQSAPVGGSGQAAARNRRSTEPSSRVSVGGGLAGAPGGRAGAGAPPSGPAVDLPSLRLALRVCVARLAQERFLRCEGAGGSSSSSEATGTAPATLELSQVEWAQLTGHRCLTTGDMGVAAPTKVDPAWFSRRFITSYTVPKTDKGRKAVGEAAEVQHHVARKRRGKRGGRGGDAVGPLGLEGHEADEEGDGSSSGGSGSGGEEDVEDEGQQVCADAPAIAPAGQRQDGAVAVEGSRESEDVEQRAPSRDAGLRDQGTADAAWPGLGSVSPGTSQVADGQSCEPAAEALFNPDDFATPSGLVVDIEDEQIQALSAHEAVELARRVVAALEVWNVQTHMNGMHNIWIVKPAGKSRGRGIRLFNNLDQMFAYVRGDDALSLEWRWVAQKYIERPLIIRQRKFDIRQWVLVTDWNPLTVYFWNTCYLRFAADNYDPANLDIYLHLSNNSIAKYYEVKKDDDITNNGNMWSVEQFKMWLGETYGDPGLWESVVQPAMKHIVVCTAKCAQDMVKARKSSCEVYGYDFLIDDQLRVWLLEINASPTMEASTPITATLCAEVQEDILKVVVDKAAAATDPSSKDIGRWELIVDAGDELRKPTYTGLNLELKGSAIKPRMPRAGAGGAVGLSGGGVAAGAMPMVPSCYQAFSQQLAAARNQADAAHAAAGSAAMSPLQAAYLSQHQHVSAARKPRASAPNGVAISQRSPSPRKPATGSAPGPHTSSPVRSSAQSKASASPMHQRGASYTGGGSFGVRTSLPASVRHVSEAAAAAEAGGGPTPFGGGGSIPEADEHEHLAPTRDQLVHLPPAPLPTSGGFLRTSSSHTRRSTDTLGRVTGGDVAGGATVLPVVPSATAATGAGQGQALGFASNGERWTPGLEDAGGRSSSMRMSVPVQRAASLIRAVAHAESFTRASLNGDDLAAIVRGDTAAAAARYMSFTGPLEQGGSLILATAPRATGSATYQQNLSVVGSSAIVAGQGGLPQLGSSVTSLARPTRR